ncbi:hypothetical protein N1H82_006593 [Pseudomonas aeruginosa]|nr:hypothetical protein [Pseudomonas aeruginosa]
MPILWLDVPAMLLAKGVVSNSYAASTTAGHAALWMEGSPIDFTKSSSKIHRARLRKIGIDIKKPYSGEFYTAEQSREIMAKRYADAESKRPPMSGEAISGEEGA